MNRFIYFYEAWILPPNNVSLIELKRKEIHEKAKYLDPKVLYTLTQEEKDELRVAGFFVDLNTNTTNKISNYTITGDRHANKYEITKPNYNMAVFQRYYYSDQQLYMFLGDYHFYNKINRVRTKVKRKTMTLLAMGLLYYLYASRNQSFNRKARNQIIKFNELNNNNPK